MNSKNYIIHLLFETYWRLTVKTKKYNQFTERHKTCVCFCAVKPESSVVSTPSRPSVVSTPSRPSVVSTPSRPNRVGPSLKIETDTDDNTHDSTASLAQSTFTSVSQHLHHLLLFLLQNIVCRCECFLSIHLCTPFREGYILATQHCTKPSTWSHSHLYNPEQQSLRFVEHPYNFNSRTKH